MCDFYLKYSFILLAFICSVLTEIKDSHKGDDLEFWNDPRLKTRRPINYRRFKDNTQSRGKKYLRQNDRKLKTVNKDNNVKKVGFRNNSSQLHILRNAGQNRWTTLNTSWPKVAPHFRAKKASTRITKMMLQEAPETSPQYMPLNEDEEEVDYLSPYAIKKQLSILSSKFPNTNITLEVIGRTVEYNDIVLMKISESSDSQRHFRAEDDKFADEPPQKKIIFIVHGLSVMGMGHVACLHDGDQFTKLLTYYFTHLDKFDIFLVPLANPDGFGNSIKDHLWNKNMSPQNACPGVSVDRNFDVAWNNTRVVPSCSQQYPGPSPFSEAESRAIRDVFHKYSHKIVAYLHVHAGSYDHNSYKGEAVLYPKGYSENQADDDKYIDLRGEIDEAMRNASFKTLSVAVDTLYNWYGQVFGTSVDYASTIYGVPYAMELVMQVYEDIYMDTDETYADSALKEIWSRVVDVIFKNIWKNTQNTDHDN